MAGTVGIPRAPEADLRVRRALQAMALLNDLWLDGTLALTAAGRTRLLLSDSQIPSTITRDSELAAAIAGVGGPLFDHYADALSTNTNGTEDDLYSDTLAAAQLANNGEKITAYYAGYWIGHATATRRLRAYFGGTVVLDTNNILVASDAPWEMQVKVIRASSSVVRVSAFIVSEATPQGVYPQVTEITGLTLANTQIMKITGTADAAGAAAGDIGAQSGSISWLPAA